MRLLDPIKPMGRAVKYGLLYRRALWQASRPLPPGTPLPRVAFIFGCGRSGTTILGKLLGEHPSIRYLFEPYHLWAAVSPITDSINLYCRVEAKLLMDADDADEESRQRFWRQIARAPRRGEPWVVEKTPLNALRLGYLEVLAPKARHIHIVRDGVVVARSIAAITARNDYRMWGRPGMNQWWGMGNSKWHALVRDGKARGYFADEVDALSTDLQRGAYEWLVTMLELDRWRDRLAARWCELTYDGFLNGPEASLRRVCQLLELEPEPAWLAACVAQVRPPKPHPPDQLVLPPQMAQAFNAYQERFGFPGRAVAG